ncbi:MAG: SCP2 sterol-binding domain-containing protein [Pseudomonadota bacterium]
MKPPLALLPAYPGSILFGVALNLAIARQLPGDVCAALEGKHVTIKVLDAGLRFDVLWQGGRFEARSAVVRPDLAIGASARDFMLLAQRREDPDTLFFSRRLSMEGDTELGLLLKNTLDAIDLAVFDPARFVPAPLLARWRR